jgi:methionyl aminopeptidase
MILVKTPEEIHIMQEGGRKLGVILSNLLSMSGAGVSLETIEQSAQKLIYKEGGTPSFQTVEGYRYATCLCVNEEVVHAPPRPLVLKEGDILTIDIGMLYQGFHTDTAWTKIITSHNFCLPAGKASLITHNSQEKLNFLKTGELTLKKAIEIARPGDRVGNISEIIEKNITEKGYSVVRALTGHGVGKNLHEEPMIPEYLEGPVEKTPLLTVGMTLAIEVIYAIGNSAIEYANNDGWTLASKDRSLTAVFEHTIALLEEKTIVLTERSL